MLFRSGDVVRVSGVGSFTSIRRVFTDGSFTAGATPWGGATPLYNGQPAAAPRPSTALTQLPSFQLKQLVTKPVIQRTTGPMRPAL